MSELMLTQEELRSLVEKLGSGQTAADALNVAPETLEELYALAHGLYTSGNHQDAETVFRALCLYNSQDYRFWLGLGASRQALERWDEAVDAYQMAGVASGLQNPEPFLHAAACLMQAGKKADAIAALKGLVTINPDDIRYAQTHARARALLELLEGA